MQKNILNRWLVITVLMILAVLLLINDAKYYTSNDNQLEGTGNPEFLFDSNIINLGLDLKGGTVYQLSPEIDKWILEKLQDDNIDKIIKEDFIEAIKSYMKSGTCSDKTSTTEKLCCENNKGDWEGSHCKGGKKRWTRQVCSLDILEKYLAKSKNKSTIEDLFGEAKETIKKNLLTILEGQKTIIQNRVDLKGVVEPSIRVYGERIEVAIPGEQNIQQIEELITSSALLEFNEMTYGPGIPHWQKNVSNVLRQFTDLKALASTVSDLDFIYLKKQNVSKFKEGVILKTNPWFNTNKFGYLNPQKYPQFSNFFEEGDRLLCILNKNKPGIKGQSVSSASVQSDGQLSTNFEIALEFDSETSKKWADYTGNNIGNIVAITLDNDILTAPTIQSRIDGGSRITGFDSYVQAENITIALNSGKFKIPLFKEGEDTISADLGKDMIGLGSFAFIIGLSCVMVFMIIYYRTSGLIASIGLIINIILMSAILSLLGATLTLPGIAGFILTVGIAIDANVIIFERIKEEIRKGTPPLSAIELGYDRAFTTILDANITTLITAFILYFLGTGPIKGFAVTLSAGILCSMFTAIYVTRTVYNSMYYSKSPKKLSI